MNIAIKIASASLFAAVLSIANADENAIKQMLLKTNPVIKIDSVKPSAIAGVFEVIVGKDVLYISEDGKYLLQGHLIDLEARKDLTQEKLSGLQKVEDEKLRPLVKSSLAKIGPEKMIVFSPKEPKYKISVFTDIDCGYCRKFHSQIDQYMAEGIAVQYLFFPRAGKDSDSYNKAVSVWCASDRKAAFTAAKKGGAPTAKKCDNPVDEHMKLVQEFGLEGTPTIVTERGTLFPGYLPPKELVEELKKDQAN
ncbi:MAG: DsbC family protein [Methylococcaceae bacterium]